MKPLNIILYEGQIKLNKSHLYICESLIEKEYKFQIENTIFAGNSSLKKDGLVTDYEVVKIDIKNDLESKITLKFEFVIGDELLLISSSCGQRFFVIDKVRKLV